LLEAVINVNNKQQAKLVEKARERFGSLQGKKVALLGLAFKPNTDDMREAASIVIAKELVKEGALVVAYDPVAIENAKRVIGNEITYVHSAEDALQDADFAMIVTEWEEIKNLPLDMFEELMKTPVVFDGRNCYALEEVVKYDIEYHSIGRESILKNLVNI
jgi:UDPglucose 6-dehydrogenase